MFHGRWREHLYQGKHKLIGYSAGESGDQNGMPCYRREFRLEKWSNIDLSMMQRQSGIFTCRW